MTFIIKMNCEYTISDIQISIDKCRANEFNKKMAIDIKHNVDAIINFFIDMLKDEVCKIVNGKFRSHDHMIDDYEIAYEGYFTHYYITKTKYIICVFHHRGRYLHPWKYFKRLEEKLTIVSNYCDKFVIVIASYVNKYDADYQSLTFENGKCDMEEIKSPWEYVIKNKIN